MSSLNMRIRTEVVYSGYAKAFNIVCHEKVPLKVDEYDVVDFLKWVRAFLHGRSFQTRARGSYSPPHPIPSGVPMEVSWAYFVPHRY